MGTSNFRSVPFGIFAIDGDTGDEWDDIWFYADLKNELKARLDELAEYYEENPPCNRIGTITYYPDDYETFKGDYDEALEEVVALPIIWEGGYYSGLQVYVDLDNYEDRELHPELVEAVEKDLEKIKKILISLGFKEYGVSARFSSGETWYEEVQR